MSVNDIHTCIHTHTHTHPSLPPKLGPATLCDQMDDWRMECKGSDTDKCVALVIGSPQSCSDYCEGQGLVCAAGQVSPTLNQTVKKYPKI